MITESHICKLMDYGHAVQLPDQKSSITLNEQAGSAQYLPPEIKILSGYEFKAGATNTFSKQTDVCSLGRSYAAFLNQQYLIKPRTWIFGISDGSMHSSIKETLEKAFPNAKYREHYVTMVKLLTHANPECRPTAKDCKKFFSDLACLYKMMETGKQDSTFYKSLEASIDAQIDTFKAKRDKIEEPKKQTDQTYKAC